MIRRPRKLRFRARRRRERGFTLIELMVALVLFSLVIAGMMAVAVSMISGYRTQEITIATEGATRSTVDYLADAIRNSSPGVGTFDNLVHLDLNSCRAGAIAVTNNVANPAPLTHASDQLTITYASGAIVTTATSAYAGTASTTIDVVDATQIAAGDYVIITNFTNGHFNRVTASTLSSPGSITLATPDCTTTPKLPTGGYLPGATIIRATRATFAIGVVPSDFGSVPVLTMDPDGDSTLIPTADAEPIAEGIEDLQVVYGADDNPADGVLSTEDFLVANNDEWIGNVSGEVMPVTLPNATRAVRVSVVARTARELTGVNTFRLNALEDRAANAANDGFRRRVLSTTIEIRNLNGSP